MWFSLHREYPDGVWPIIEFPRMEGHHDIVCKFPDITFRSGPGNGDPDVDIQLASTIESPVVLQWRDSIVDFAMWAAAHTDEDANARTAIIGQDFDYQWDAALNTSFSMELECVL